MGLRERLHNRVDLFIPDPPYNILPEARDRFTSVDMDHVVQACVQLLADTGTAVIFCSYEQCIQWQKKFRRAGMVVEKTPLHIVLAESSAHTSRHSRTLHSIVQYACLVHRTAAFKANYSRIQEQNPGCMTPTLPGSPHTLPLSLPARNHTTLRVRSVHELPQQLSSPTWCSTPL